MFYNTQPGVPGNIGVLFLAGKKNQTRMKAVYSVSTLNSKPKDIIYIEPPVFIDSNSLARFRNKDIRHRL